MPPSFFLSMVSHLVPVLRLIFSIVSSIRRSYQRIYASFYTTSPRSSALGCKDSAGTILGTSSEAVLLGTNCWRVKWRDLNSKKHHVFLGWYVGLVFNSVHFTTRHDSSLMEDEEVDSAASLFGIFAEVGKQHGLLFSGLGCNIIV